MPRKALYLLILLASLSFLSSCRDSEQRTDSTDHARDAISVRLQGVQKTGRPSVFKADGTVEARAKVDLAFKVSGKVVQIFFKEGDAVRANQVLAELNAVPFKQALDTAISKDAEARVNAARAEAKYRHMKRLYEKKGLSPNEFKKYETARVAAKAKLTRAESKVKAARRRLMDIRVTTPIKGFILSRSVHTGETVAAGRPVFTIADIDRVTVEVTAPESELGSFRQDQSATVLVPSLNGRAFSGKVAAVGPKADPATGSVSLKIEMDNPKRILRSGMVAEVRIENDRTPDILRVPAKAVVRDAQGTARVFVYAPEQKKVFARPVETGAEADGAIVITKGLTGDERVVSEGAESLTDGARANVVREE